MELILLNDKFRAKKLEKLFSRPSAPEEISERAFAIADDVKKNGDKALERLTKEIDRVPLKAKDFLVKPSEYAAAEKALTSAQKKAVAAALKNITSFAKSTVPETRSFNPRDGVTTGERFIPMDRVGCYVPGGTAPLVSSVIHTVAIAKATGVKEIAAATPPMKDGKVNACTLYALKKAGATEVWKIGGAQAVAALAFGTKTIKKVDKVVGPGNAYVAAAKRAVFGACAVDMVAGPSEVMVIADGKANAAFVAADMLSQAEHGSGLEQAVLVSDSAELLNEVQSEIFEQAETLTRQGPLSKVMANGIFLIQVKNMAEAAETASSYAPEHLEIHCADPEKVAGKVRAAGAIFLGQWTPEPAGDFTAGPSHVLPTGGTAKFFHGITASDFMRRTSFLKYTKEALLKEVPFITEFAAMEGLDAHGRSASIRKTGKRKTTIQAKNNKKK